jgi:hypothetical protein
LCAELGNLSDFSGINTVLISVENLWYINYLFVLLMSVLVRDVAKLEEESYWNAEKLLSPSVLLACKQVECYTAKFVGQLVQVKRKVLECVDLLNSWHP